jgi:hypothetical protein
MTVLLILFKGLGITDASLPIDTTAGQSSRNKVTPCTLSGACRFEAGLTSGLPEQLIMGRLGNR